MKLYHFLKSNLDVIKAVNPALHDWLFAQEYDMQSLEDGIFHNAQGALDWKLPGGRGLFEPVPPKAWYGSWTYDESAERSATVIVGCNLGYGINHALMATPQSHKIFVVEPRAEMLLACLGQTDYAEFLKAGRLHFLVPTEDAVLDMVRRLDIQFLFGRVLLREDTPSRQIGPEYAYWVQRCRARMESFMVEMTTLRMRQDVMVGNELKNYSRAARDGSLLPLKGRGAGVSAVIFGAGPSLDQKAAHFAGRAPDALYVTSLQALPSLQRHGILPHFCLAIDYSEGMRAVFDRLDLDAAAKVPLIYSTKIDPLVLERYPGPTIPLWTMGGVSTFVFNGRELVLDAGGNVGVTMLRLLSWAGVERALLVGQDFATPGGSTHAAGHHGGKDLDVIRNIYSVETKDANGNVIHTSPQLLAARRDMEDDLAKTALRVFNLYGGGSPIKGAQSVTWEDIQERGLLACAAGGLEAFVAGLRLARSPKPKPVFEARARGWASSMRHVERRLDKLFRKLDRNQREINQTLRQIEVFAKHDQLYTPYLFNEIMDLAGLIHARCRYERKDLAAMKELFRRMVDKVREMDACLGAAPAHAA